MTSFSPSRGAIWLRAALLLAVLALGLPNALAQLVAPVIVSHPQSQTAAVGADVTFSITVTNTASLPLTNRLRRAGQNIATNIVNAHSTSFTLRNVQTNDASTYAIGALNAAGIRLSSNAVLTVVRPVAVAGYGIAAESCLPANGAIDPGETVTLAFALSATNGYYAANLVATLEETNGVVAPGGPQTYGELPADGTPVTRSFTFTANGACGGQVRATLRLFDGANDWGRVTVVLPLGTTTANGPECCTASLADLAVTIAHQPEAVAVASNVTWTITVTNRGPETARNVVVTNRLAPELLYLSAQAGAGACAVQQGVLVCQIDEVPANTSWPIEITALANAVGTITNQAVVTSTQADPSGADNVSARPVTRIIQPTVRINNTTVDEGETGMSYAIFDVRLSFPIQRTVTVQYTTVDDTATADEDYLPQSGTVTFPPGTTEQQIIVIVFGDEEPEVSEVFWIDLSVQSNSALVATRARCAIRPDEAKPYPPNSVHQLWTTTTSNIIPSSIFADRLGNCWVVGSWSNGPPLPPNTDYGIARYNESGSLLWLRRYGLSSGAFAPNETATALIVDDLGNAYVTGNAGTVKYDSDGSLLWASTNAVGKFLGIDSDRNVIVLGTRAMPGNYALSILKSTTNGEVLWERFISRTNSLRVVSLAIDRDGSSIVLGAEHATGILTKYDSEGRILWTRSLTSGVATRLTVDSLGDVYVCSQAGQIIVRKHSGLDGDLIWEKRHQSAIQDYESPDGDLPCRIAIDSDDNILVAGTLNGSTLPVLIKYGPDGSNHWVAHFPAYYRNSFTTDLVVDNEGNAYMAGRGSYFETNAVGVHFAWMIDAHGYRRWVHSADGDGGVDYSLLDPRFNGTRTPVIALNPNRFLFMAGPRGVFGSPSSCGLTAMYPATVAGVPEIVGPLIIETNIFSGQMEQVSVQGRGDPILSYEWFTRGTGIMRRDLSTSNQLYAISSYPLDHVVVSNFLGTIASPSINYPSLRSTIYAGFRNAIALGELGVFKGQLQLSAEDMNQGLQWLHNGDLIVGQTNLLFTIISAQANDAGEYQLIASNSFGPIISKPARLTVAAQLEALPLPSPTTNLPPSLSTRVIDLASNEVVTQFDPNTPAGSFTAKFDFAGNVLWRSSLGGRGLALDSSGNTYIAWDEAPAADIFIAKLDSLGAVAWTSRFSGHDIGREVMSSMIGDADGNLWIGASRRIGESPEYYDGDLVGVKFHEYPIVLRYDEHGTLLWHLSRDPLFWSVNYSTPMPTGPTLHLDAEGDLFVAGRGFGNVRYREVPVAGLPTLVSRPQDRVVDADEAVTLAVEAQGQGPLFYHWRKDGVFMPGATNATLEFAAVQIEDAGDYSVEIRNQLGTIHTAEARLSVQSPPKIRRQPGDAVVLAGARVTFSAVVVGSPPLAYQWRFNDVPLAGATNNSLLITNVTPSVTGFYTLVVTNAYGAVTSAPARLEIWQPPVVEGSVGRTNVPLGGTIELAIEANGTPPLRYQWRRNGVNIPGATNFTYTIDQARLSDGGTYTVLVANGAGAVLSDPIVVVIEVPQQPPGDNFTNRTLVTGVTNAVGGTNRWATREVGEPLHAGKFGSNSVWYRWVAPVSGIATFRTVGSTFDTLLGIYTGTNVAELTAVAEDEDRGGFFTSELRFNAEQGRDYAIAIDGFFGQQGSFILTWEVETTAQSLPVITTPPRSQTVRAGAGVLLQVAATGAGLTYQWHFNGTRIAGASGAAFAVNNVQPANVGLYTVAITNNAGRGIESLPAMIEIGPVPAVQGQDKLEDLFGDMPPLGGGGGIIAAALPSTFISVSAGTVDYQITSTRDATSQSWEPNHCGVIGGASKWFEFHATDDATVAIDTRGSTFDTVLAVYRKVGVLQLAQNRIDCSTDWQPGANWSRVSFQAQRNASYYVVVDGANVNDLTGRAQLNWAMGRQPTIVTAPQFDLVRPGQHWRFTAGVTNAIPPPTYRWYHNGRVIPGATNDWYELASLQLTNAGVYTVTVSNALGEAQQLIAQLTAPTLTSELRVTDGAYRLTLAPVEQPGAATLLESSTNLVDWTPVQLHTNTATPVTLTLPLNSAQRFFRTRPVE